MIYATWYIVKGAVREPKRGLLVSTGIAHFAQPVWEMANLKETVIQGPVGDAAVELIFSVQCCLGTRLLSCLGHERLYVYT